MITNNNPHSPHILYVITQGELGGAQRYLLDLVTHLKDEYMISVAIGTEAGPLGETLGELNIPIHVLPALGRNIHATNDLKAKQQLKRLFIKLQPDIVHLNSTKVGILGSLASRGLHHKLVYTVHGWVFEEPLSHWKRLFYLFAEMLTAKRKDAFILLSDRECTIAHHRVGIVQKKCHLIPNGIDPTSPRLTDQHTEILSHISRWKNEGNRVYVTIGNFYKTKGIDLLVEAAAVLRDKNIQIGIIGDGIERPLIESLITKHHLHDMVHLFGRVPDAAALLPYADGIILPSRKEGLSYVLLEALRAKRPIIATDVGAHAEVLADLPGTEVIPANDSQAIATAIQAWIDYPPIESPSLPQKNHLTEMITKTKKLYSNLLDR